MLPIGIKGWFSRRWSPRHRVDRLEDHSIARSSRWTYRSVKPQPNTPVVNVGRIVAVFSVSSPRDHEAILGNTPDFRTSGLPGSSRRVLRDLPARMF